MNHLTDHLEEACLVKGCPMTTNPIIARKLEDFTNDGTLLVTREQFTEAMTEAYEAGEEAQKEHDREIIQQLISPQLDAAKAARQEAQRETAKEILEMLEKNRQLLSWSGDLEDVRAEGANEMLVELKALITSKYLQPEDKPTDTNS
jgi:hypothetical protein